MNFKRIFDIKKVCKRSEKKEDEMSSDDSFLESDIQTKFLNRKKNRSPTDESPQHESKKHASDCNRFVDVSDELDQSAVIERVPDVIVEKDPEGDCEIDQPVEEDRNYGKIVFFGIPEGREEFNNPMAFRKDNLIAKFEDLRVRLFLEMRKRVNSMKMAWSMQGILRIEYFVDIHMKEDNIMYIYSHQSPGNVPFMDQIAFQVYICYKDARCFTVLYDDDGLVAYTECPEFVEDIRRIEILALDDDEESNMSTRMSKDKDDNLSSCSELTEIL